MAYNYLTPDNVIETFKTSRQYTEALTDLTFFEYERIARNKPHASIPKEYPKTTDGTTASIIRKTPHRIIQQLPIGTVKNDTEDWLSVIAEFIYRRKIIPSANEGYALLQKCWSIVERSLTFGFCPIYTPFVNHDGYFCTDMRLPYWGDIFVQPGKLSDQDSNYIFMRSWWQTKDIEALIDSQSKISKGVEQTWDTANLKLVKDYTSTKEEKAQTPIEREKSVNTKGGVELITGFQRGVGAKFFTFHVSSGLIVRTKTSKDPRGELPISFAYGDIDGFNPFGRSVIDLVGSLQNLIDGEMQMYQYNRALMLNPPLIKRGAWSKSKIKFAPNVIIDMGSGDPNVNNLEALKIDSTALANFPNNYGLMKSQMLNLLSSPDTSISADIGNPGFSKTPQGVDASRANLSVDDNYVRKQFETAYGRWSETAINLYFAERTGIEELQLDDETADELRQLPEFAPGGQNPDGSTTPPGELAGTLSPDNKIRVNYDTATPALKFIVTTDSSKTENDPAQQAIAENLLQTVMKFPMLNAAWGGPIDVDALAHTIVETSGIDHMDLIAPEPTAQQKAAKLQAKQKPNGFSPMFDKPKLDIRYPDLPPAAQVQLLGLAGIQVSMQDVLEGPVVDPNMRGTINPINDTQMLTPGGGQAIQGIPGQTPNPLQQDGVNLSPQEIQRLQQDPRFAQTQQMAALKQQAYTPQQPPQPTQQAAPDQTQMTPDHILKAHAQAHDQALKEDQQAHQQQMDQAKLQLEAAKVGIQAHDSVTKAKDSQTKEKIANKPVPKAAPAKKPKKVSK